MKLPNNASCKRWANMLIVQTENLSPEEQTALQEHLNTCDRCRDEYSIHQRMIRDLQHLPAYLEPPQRQMRLQQIKLYHAQNKTAVGKGVVREEYTTQPTRGGIGLQLRMNFRYQSRMVQVGLAVIAVLVAMLVILPGIRPGSVVEAASLSLGVPSKTRTIDWSAWAHTVAWSPNGNDIATLWSDNTMQVWNANDGKESFHVNDIGWGAGLAFSPHDGKYLASVGTDTTIQIFDVAACQAQLSTCQPILIYQGHEEPIEALSWSPDGTQIASASDDGTVRIWNVHTGNTLSVYQDTARAGINAVAWSPDGQRIVYGDDMGNVEIRNVFTRQLLLNYSDPLDHYIDPVTSVSWSHDSKYIASSGYRGIARIWNAQTGQTIARIPSTENGLVTGSGNDPIYTVVWSHSSSLIALASYDTIQVWDLATDKPQQIGTGYQPSAHSSDRGFAHHPTTGEANVFTVAWSPNDHCIVAGGQGYTLRFNFPG